MTALRDPRRLLALVGLGSTGLLLAAFGFQHLGGLAPCELCIWQRWPHVAVAVAGLACWFSPRFAKPLGIAVALVGLVSAALALYHVGVEQHWWSGPTACAGMRMDALSVEQLIARIETAPLVRCDEVAWSLAGLSMAGWNGLFSLGIAAFGALAARQASSSASQYR